MASESYIEGVCCRWAFDTYGIIALKLNSRNGLPDRLFLCNSGKIFFVEFKFPGKKPRKLQEEIHNSLRKKGFIVLVIDNVEHFKIYVRSLNNENLQSTSLPS